MLDGREVFFLVGIQLTIRDSSSPSTTLCYDFPTTVLCFFNVFIDCSFCNGWVQHKFSDDGDDDSCYSTCQYDCLCTKMTTV